MNLCSDYSAKKKQAFNDHFAKHENEKLVCDLCGKTFDTPGRLRSHRLVYHGDKDYSCEKCEKTFSKKDHLRRHTRNPNCSKLERQFASIRDASLRYFYMMKALVNKQKSSDWMTERKKRNFKIL